MSVRTTARCASLLAGVGLAAPANTPAPKSGEFSLYVRAYWPKVAITDGSWTPPPVQRTN